MGLIIPAVVVAVGLPQRTRQSDFDSCKGFGIVPELLFLGYFGDFEALWLSS
jgi:hypothetical protein